jgi:hypothetical protein
MYGNRGIVFIFECEGGSRPKVIFDFYGNGSKFNGAEYCKMESAALNAVIAEGYDVKTFTHFLI